MSSPPPAIDFVRYSGPRGAAWLKDAATMLAAARLLQRLDATVVEAAAIVDLPERGGSALLRAAGVPVFTVCDFAGH